MGSEVVFVLYLAAILGFLGVTFALNRLLGPKPVNSPLKMEAFECGATPVDPINVKPVPIKYYALAVVFILLDLETVFLFIWAVGAQPITGFLLITLGFFLLLLVLMLAYVWKARLVEGVTE